MSCSTSGYWFSIVIYSTWRLTADQNIDFLFDLPHLATYSTPYYWFSIGICTTWRLAAHQDIDFGIVIYNTWQLAAHQNVDFYRNLQHLATCSAPEYWFSVISYSTLRNLQRTIVLIFHRNLPHWAEENQRATRGTQENQKKLMKTERKNKDRLREI